MAGFFSWSSSKSSGQSLPEIFPMSVRQGDFVNIDCEAIYKRILTDVLERTDGIAEERTPLLWDNCLASEKKDGLVSTLAKAMVGQKELFLAYNPTLKLVRQATTEEEAQIKADYEKKGESSVGIYVTFKNFKQSTMVRFYSELEYCGVASFWKSMNLSKALQIKINELRSSTGLNDKADIETQAIAISEALGKGLDIYIDAKDVLELLNPDLTATNSAMELIEKKRSFYLGLPASYLQGEGSKGLSDTGKGDSKKIEQGLRNYYFSIVKPVVEALFGDKTTYKSNDFDQILASMEVMKTFAVTDNDMVSLENKTKILNSMLGLPEDAEGDEPEEPVTDPVTGIPIDPNAKPVAKNDPNKVPQKPGEKK